LNYTVIFGKGFPSKDYSAAIIIRQIRKTEFLNLTAKTRSKKIGNADEHY
jgi:hypothetical protein